MCSFDFLCGRICRAEVDRFPCGPVPVGSMSSGNFMEGEGERSRVTSQSPLRTRPQTMTLGWTLHGMECRQQTLTVRAALGDCLAAGTEDGVGGGICCSELTLYRRLLGEIAAVPGLRRGCLAAGLGCCSFLGRTVGLLFFSWSHMPWSQVT